jgi:hypothetical protein
MVPNPEQGLWNTSNPAKLRATPVYGGLSGVFKTLSR